MEILGVVKSLDGGKFYAKDPSGNVRELNVGDEISRNDLVFGDDVNSSAAKINIELLGSDVVVVNQDSNQLIDASLDEASFGNEELSFAKGDIDAAIKNLQLSAWNNTSNDISDDMDTAAGDVTEQETNAGNEEARDGGALRSKFNARDGSSTDVVSDLRDASWADETENRIEELPQEEPLQIVYTTIEGIGVVSEGESAQYVVKLVDSQGNPVIATQDTIIYVTYTNKTTQNGDTQYNHNTVIEVVIKAGTSQSTFIINTIDDYLADNGEIYNVRITGNNSTEYDVRNGDVNGNKTNVDTTILDNSDPNNPGGENGGYGPEDTVYAIIEGSKEVWEGEHATYTVKLVDKDGNPVVVTKDTEVTVKYSKGTTQDSDTEYKDGDTIKVIIKSGSSSADFVVNTIDDYLADNGEEYNVAIDNVDDKGQFEKVNIGDINGDKTDVDTTIFDNSKDPLNPGEDGGYGPEDTVYVTIEKPATVKEGESAEYTVFIKDKDGNPVIVDEDTVITITYTDKTTSSGDTQYNNKETITVTIPKGKSSVDFEVKTNEDNLVENDEVYNLEITNVDDKGQYEKVSIGDINGKGKDVDTTILDGTVRIVLVAVESETTTIADITDADGKLIIKDVNSTQEGGKLHYIAVAVDKDGKPLANQGGKVDVSYGQTQDPSDKDASSNDYDINGNTQVDIGKVFTVDSVDDFYAEGDEKFTVTISNPKDTPYNTVAVDTKNDEVVSTIKDNPANDTENPATPTEDGGYGVEDSIYIRIVSPDKTVEGGTLEHKFEIGYYQNGVWTPHTAETDITIKVKYDSTNGVDDQDFAKDRELEITIPKGQNSITITNETKVDFEKEGQEDYTVTITGVSQKDPVYENVAIDSKNSTTGTILDGIVLADPEDSYVDEDNFYKNNNDGTNSSIKNSNISAGEKSLGFKVPADYETEVGTFKVNFVGEPTLGGVSELTSNGVKVVYEINGNTIVGKAGNVKVFDIVLSKNGTYTYKQYANIDHPKAGNVSTPEGKVEFNDKDNIDLNFKFNITTTSKNGQTVTSPDQGFKVTVNDSSPDAGTRTETMNEDGTLTVVLSDESFKDGKIEIDNGNGYQVVDKNQVVDIYDGTEVIGKLKNNGNGTLTFTPNKDYSKYEPDGDYLPNFKYKVSDTDGDYAEGQINIHVKPVTDGTTINVKNVETFEDNKNTEEGKHSVSLGLVQPVIKDNKDQNNGAKGDHGERVDYITLKFTNGAAVNGAILEKADGTDILTITKNTDAVKIVIVKDDGAGNKVVDTSFHHSDVKLGEPGVVYLTKEEYEGLKINHAEDNDTDIRINISTKTHEVDDSGKPLPTVPSKTDSANMTVKIKAVTDDISLKWDDESLGKISDDGKKYTFNDIKEGNAAIDLKSILTKTSGTELNDGTPGNKADLDGSEKRTYTISGIPEGTIVILGGQTAVANSKGIATIEFNNTNNTKADPDFSMKFPKDYSGTVNGKIVLSVYDNGVESGDRDTTDYGNGANGIKTAEVDFKVNVYPDADQDKENTIKVSQAVGYEDAGRSKGNTSNNPDEASKVDEPQKGIPLEIQVNSTDKDGSETITISIGDIPSGGYIYYKGGLYGEDGFVSGIKTEDVTVTKNGNTWKITIPEYENQSPKFIPPHNSDEEYTLKVTGQTVDTAIIDGQKVVSTSDISSPKDIHVTVKGVADIPVGTELNNDGNENAYTVNENDLDNSGNKFDLKVIYKDSSKVDSYDNDGSEELSIVIKGLPAGFGIEGGLPTGDGEWAFNAKDLDKVKITTPPNFSGKADFTLTYVTTEREGNSKVHHTQEVNIYVNPEIDSTINNKSIGNEDEVVFINFNIVYNNKDYDETLEEVKINVNDVTGKEFTLYVNGVDIKDAGLTIKDGYYVLTPDQSKTVTAKGNENVSGDYKFDVKYTIKDVANDGKSVSEEFETSHELVINPVTDQPEIDFGTIVVTGNNITVNGTEIKIVGDKKSTIEIPVETTSPDTDGSERVVEIKIEGVPAGVRVVGGESSEDAFIISVNNGVWTIKVDETITDLNDIIKNIKFEIDSDAKFSHREITITTVTQDKDAPTKEASKTITIDHDKAHGGGGSAGYGAEFGLKAKDFTATEDTSFRLTNLFEINTNGGDIEGSSWTVTLTDLPAGTIINGTVIGEDGKYVIESKLTGQDMYDIESILSQIKITPPSNLNDFDGSTKSMTITATIDTKNANGDIVSSSTVNNDSTILPVTDKMIVSIDSVNQIDESGTVEFDITLSSTGDKESRTDIIGKTIVISISENFEAGETATGELYYNGQLLTKNANGQYEIKVPDGYKFGDKIEGLEYKSADQRHGEVTITASIKHQETQNHDNYETKVQNASGSTVITVKPVLDANVDNLKVEANSTEDTIIPFVIDDKDFITDNSENLINVVFNGIPKDFIVYYKDANGNSKMAVNRGDGKWLIPIVDGKLPDGIQIKAPEHYSGEFKFDMDFYIKEQGLDLQKVTKEATVSVTPIADGVSIDPTLSGIQSDGKLATSFEWTDLNLNANMKDIDGSETLTLRFEGLNDSAQFRILNSDGTSKVLDAVYENGKWTVGGISVDDINNIQLLHDKAATVKVTGYTVDTATNENGDIIGQDVSSEVDASFDLKIDSNIQNGKFTLGKEVSIDFDKIEDISLKNLKEIDLGKNNGENKLLNMELKDLLSMSGNNKSIVIKGGEDDKVTFKDTIDEDGNENKWTKVAGTGDDLGFDIYTNSGDPTLQVKVEEQISDGITN